MVSANAQSKRASLLTHGCRLNQSETQTIREHLERAGYRIVPFGEEAELGIINTCTVTREAESKCRQSIRQFVRRNPGAFTAVIGCYSQTGAAELAELGGVDLLIGNQDKMAVLDYLRAGKNERPLVVRERIDSDDFTMRFVGDLPSQLRANLKVQDGCDFMCDFCIIPMARGRARSRAFENLMDEARSLAASGVREIVLTGVNIGTYDHGGRTVTDIVDALDALEGLARVRISSIEPTTIPRELFARMADPAHALVPFLHIPLQSGCDAVLQLMRRRYDTREFLDFIHEAAAAVPDLCIGTDIMVGHPGETEAMFEQTCRFFLDSPAHYSHVFPFSERPGTLAVKRTDTHAVPMEERRQRSAHLRRLSAMKRHDFYEKHLGTVRPVLFENPANGAYGGYTDNYIRVRTQSREPLANRLCNVRLDRVVTDFVECSLVEIPEPC